MLQRQVKMSTEKIILLSIFLLKILIYTKSCKGDNGTVVEDDYAYDYYEDYYVTDNSQDEASSSIKEGFHVSPYVTGYSENNLKVTCSQKQITLIISTGMLPEGLELFVNKDMITSSKRCLNYVYNRTTTVYSVDITCDQFITSEQIGENLFFRHEVQLVRKGTTAENFTLYSTVYSILMECEQFGSGGRNSSVVFPSNTYSRAERRIFEHRVSSGNENPCSIIECPYGRLCLPQNEIDGYYCICAEGYNCNPQCSSDYYGCDRQQSDQLQCISNGWLCDKRYDCPLKDDEASCTEIWSSWSLWSKCSNKCGNGAVQKRQRSCDVAFLRDPERCKLYKEATGCSRNCYQREQIQYQNRTCTGRRCVSVKCGRRHMTVVIPRESSMTDHSIQNQMVLGEDPRCKPRFNNTHVIFITFLNRCNMTLQIDGDTVIYRNKIRYMSDPDQSKIIMRDLGQSYDVKCHFKRRKKVFLQKNNIVNRRKNEIAVLNFDYGNKTNQWNERMSNNIEEHQASGDGQFEFTMDLYKDKSYSEPYPPESYPLYKNLHDEIFVAIHFRTVDDDLTMRIDRCIATPTPTRNQAQQTYVFIDDGCSVDKTVGLYTVDLGPKSACFSIETFKFANASLPNVYFQCNITVCDVDDNHCRSNCNQPKKDQTKFREKRSIKHSFSPIDEEVVRGHVIQGPIVIEETSEVQLPNTSKSVIRRKVFSSKELSPKEEASKNDESPSFMYILTGTVVGFACLFVGVLVGVLGSRKLKSKPILV